MSLTLNSGCIRALRGIDLQVCPSFSPQIDTRELNQQKRPRLTESVSVSRQLDMQTCPSLLTVILLVP